MNAFSMEGYKTLLSGFVSAGYDFRFFDGTYDTSGVVFLRHDVDFHIPCAVQIAALERNMGIRSTFFFLINSELYNLLEAENLRQAKQIADMGHMVCFHVDETALHTLDNQDARACFQKQAAAFTAMLPFAERHVISRHRPDLSKAADWIPDGVLDVYSAPFFKDIEYASDSRGRWAYGHPTGREAFRQKNSFQLLTHPVWWVRNEENSRDKLNSVLMERQEAGRRYINGYDL